MQKLFKILGLGVLDPKEGKLTRQVSGLFDFILLWVVFWLPMQWYLQSKGVLTAQFILISHWIIWAVFALELVIMFSLVQRKFYYLLTDWLNIFIIIVIFPPLWAHSSPYFAVLRYLRILVLIRLIFPQLANMYRLLMRNSFGMTLIVFLLVTILSGVLVSYIDPEIGSPWQGIWWAWQTVTTVGYGNVVPNTFAGRIFAMMLMLVGVGLFSLVSANLAAHFIQRGQAQKSKKPERQMQKQFRELHDRMEKLEQFNHRLENKIDQLLK